MTDYNPSDDSPDRDPDDELSVDRDDELVDDRLGVGESDTPDAERVLREAGGDADRAEDIVETRRLAHDRELLDIPADERPVV
jgi:hypothetical protein